MNTLYVILLTLGLGSLIFIGYRRPHLVRTGNFVVTRMCFGLCILLHVTPMLLAEYIIPTMQAGDLITDPRGKATTILTLVSTSTVLSWLAIIFTYRGIFEILAQPAPVRVARGIPHSSAPNKAEAETPS